MVVVAAVLCGALLGGLFCCSAKGTSPVLLFVFPSAFEQDAGSTDLSSSSILALVQDSSRCSCGLCVVVWRGAGGADDDEW